MATYPFADLELARRLEHAEARANAALVDARAALEPHVGATWIDVAGAFAMFDGPTSPVTQTFGLGLFDPVEASHLDRLEAFFHERGAPVCHEVSPLAGAALFAALVASQRNAERRGFGIAYTRMKWELTPHN